MLPDPAAPLLAFDTSTDILSAAVWCRGRHVGRSSAGGAQASATLIPLVRALLAEAGVEMAALGAIVFGRGPGSFTGLRTACAVAQGLAWGARPGGVPVLPVDTLLAVAEEARFCHGISQVVAALDARMDEIYLARYRWREDADAWDAVGELGLQAPEAVAVASGWTLAGNARAAYGERLASGAPAVAALPTANALLRLAPALMAGGGLVRASEALPLYVRDKVARTTAERDADRIARSGVGALPDTKPGAAVLPPALER